ncbi:hypothetical protein BCR33DRAFT_711047 [Rhizoclosmatium globosum]|uniref:Major facilitator superfamily (MFS) profile domain-containing protein n=1 Tax=Rhizoclosmatium globosum TaxID=329046 RepID=A0A1Y2D313_9FUNG|nr:hypothetical protein BCR33DRAFT_711047 [Rhizoclosmatium globosum]|eukprot:ORY53688.1 hypothetical protein BCR33DRAFT_711047 [Rhizoclosmatium globosum]
MAIDAAFALALIVGPVAGGALVEYGGFLLTFGVMTAVSMSLVLFVLLKVTETRVLRNTSDASKPIIALLMYSVSQTSVTLKTILKHITAASLLLIMTILSFQLSGFQVLYLFSPATRFGWTAFDSGLFAVIIAIQTIIWLVILIPRITEYATRALHIPKLTTEIRILQTGLFSVSLGMILYGFSTTSAQFRASSVVAVMGCFANPTLRSLLSVLVPSHLQGSLFSAIQILESISMIASGITLNFLYRYTTVEWNAPQACFYIVGGLFGLAFLISLAGVSKQGVDAMAVNPGNMMDEEDDIGRGRSEFDSATEAPLLS